MKKKKDSGAADRLRGHQFKPGGGRIGVAPEVEPDADDKPMPKDNGAAQRIRGFASKGTPMKAPVGKSATKPNPFAKEGASSSDGTL